MQSNPRKPDVRDGWIGIAIAFFILGAWAISLTILLTQPIGFWSYWLVPFFVLLQGFLYTGLFITAHDAMHGIIFPQNRQVNDIVGALAVTFYALFSYRKLRSKHWGHHAAPVSDDDPDFHDGEHSHPIAWYWTFMRNYMTLWQLAGLALVFNILLHLAGIELINLILFWTLPSLLSTVQLFYFGTYLPHHTEGGDFLDHHKARSNNFSPFWSFLTCYHFGYHWEHHAYPYIPWWRLPDIRYKLQSDSEF